MAGGRAGLDPRGGQPWLMLHRTADCHRELPRQSTDGSSPSGRSERWAATVVVVAAYHLLPPDKLAGISQGVVLAVGLLADEPAGTPPRPSRPMTTWPSSSAGSSSPQDFAAHVLSRPPRKKPEP